MGGGRTQRANTIKRCLAEIGSGRRVDAETNNTFGKVVVIVGEAEWAAMQTLHVADSVAFEC